MNNCIFGCSLPLQASSPTARPAKARPSVPAPSPLPQPPGPFNGAAEGAAGGGGGAQCVERSVTSRRLEAAASVGGEGRPAGAGRPEAALAAGWDPRGAAAHLACSAPIPGGGGDGTMPFDFRRFDIYRKVPKDLTQPTYTGAIISVCCCLFILFLFLSELTGFITTEIVNELYVDDPDKDSGGKIDVSLNISLPNLHCELVGLDIQDEMGRHEVGHIDNSMKIPLNNGVGCRFEGQFSINKVPGNFHVSTHSATAQPQNPDMTHIIHKLSFGDTLQGQASSGSQSPGLRVCMRCLPGPQRPRRFQRSRGSRQTHLQPPRLPRLHPEDRAHGLRRQERQAAVLLPVHRGQQGVRRLQPHGPHHPRHLVPLRPEPHHGQVHGETAASVPVHHHDEHDEVQPLRDLGPQQKPQTSFQCPLPRAQENHVVSTLQGAATEVQRPLHAHPQGRRGPGGSRALQRSANWQGSPGVYEEVRHPH
uniref:Endoplasmic reticulum-Golgi intermediate compartment protein n=1 Tax=Bos indicus x Bos taurus TaxID=30522 RepID=A0A4W2GBV7_BOBOX